MTYKLVAAFVLFSAVGLYNFKPMTDSEASTLRQLHILFRHGDRTNVSLHTYPNDPYKTETYYPYGPGELTKKGKIKSYRLGKAIRERYDKFLGRRWNPNILEALTSDTGRTKMTLLLVLARLFPPLEDDLFEEELNWQPIPYSHKPLSNDKLFFGIVSPNFKKTFKEHESGKDVQTVMDDYKDIITYINLHSGFKNTTLFDLFSLYGTLITENEWGLALPAWTKKVFPYPLHDLAIEFLKQSSGTPALRKYVSGYFLKKVVEECKAKINGKLKEGRKLYLYSGHDVNIAHLLNTLDLFKHHIPPYNAYVIFELHEIKGIYGIKLFYQDYSSREPQLLQLPGCEAFCPFDKFLEYIQEYIPGKSDNKCDS